MKKILFLADSWGYTKGGINSFNIELCKSVAEIIPSRIDVLCVTPYSSKEQVVEAKESSVNLISLHDKPKFESFQESDMYKLADLLDKGELLWIIGHDVITGKEAINLKTIFQTRKNHSPKVGIIHHMDYESYSVFKASSKESKSNLLEKIVNQKSTLEQADVLFAVGPYLKDSASDIIEKNVSMLVPGLNESPINTNIFKKFKIIAFGRLDEENDIIKQSSLVVKAFGSAIAKDNRLKESILTMIGIQDGTEQLKELLSKGEEYAGRKITVNGIPYVANRDTLKSILDQQSLCIMPSLREGFGLVGWEAISAGIPIIISDVSGLYKFLSNFGGTVEGCINKIDIKATDEDINTLSSLIIDIFNEKEKAKQNAVSLKNYLLNEGYTWKKTANSFLNVLGLPINPLKSLKVPFKYLNSFEENDKELFFGRESDAAEFIRKLDNNHSFLLLFGKSGVGKTSFINASIINKLNQEFFFTKILRPGINNITFIENEIKEFLNKKEVKAGNSIIIFDQFEEIFINYNDFDRLQLLNYISNIQRDSNVKFILSFREDFLAEIHDIEKIIPSIFDNRFRLKNLSTSGAFEAIKKPFSLFKCKINDHLINIIINDLLQTSDNSIFPPQLQILCYTLYERFGGANNEISQNDYESIGGIKGILAEYVDVALEIFDFQEKSIAKEILKKLVSSKGTKIPLKYSELILILNNNSNGLTKERLEEIIRVLIKSRLIIKYEYSEELSYELTHEYLIEKIKEWLNYESFKIKEIEEILNQEQVYWKSQFKTMELVRFKYICQFKNMLYLDEFKKALLLRTSLEHNFDTDYWIKENLDNSMIVDFFMNDLPRIKKLDVRNRIISLLLLFNLKESHKVFLFDQILLFGDRTILVNYKKWARANNKYNIKDEVEIRRNIETKTLEKMVFVEEGVFIMGRDENELNELISNGISSSFFEDESKSEKIFVNSFLIDKYLVTNEEYKEVFNEYSFQEGLEKFPATSVSFDEASSFAKFHGKEIPNEIYWEKAARGTDGRKFPWGNQWDKNRCNTRLSGISGTTQVDFYDNGISPYGCYDMAGNVWEWTNTSKEKDKTRIVRGGSWVKMNILPWCSYKFNYENEGQQNVGFRCIRKIENDLQNSDKVYSSGGVILDNQLGELKVLLCKNNSKNEYRLPKGMLEKNEMIRECAFREVLEETGYKTVIKSFIDFSSWSYIYDNKVWDETAFFYLMEIKDNIQIEHDNEFDEIVWFSIKDAVNIMTYDIEREIIKKGVDLFNTMEKH